MARSIAPSDMVNPPVYSVVTEPLSDCSSNLLSLILLLLGWFSSFKVPRVSECLFWLVFVFAKPVFGLNVALGGFIPCLLPNSDWIELLSSEVEPDFKLLVDKWSEEFRAGFEGVEILLPVAIRTVSPLFLGLGRFCKFNLGRGGDNFFSSSVIGCLVKRLVWEAWSGDVSKEPSSGTNLPLFLWISGLIDYSWRKKDSLPFQHFDS